MKKKVKTNPDVKKTKETIEDLVNKNYKEKYNTKSNRK